MNNQEIRAKALEIAILSKFEDGTGFHKDNKSLMEYILQRAETVAEYIRNDPPKSS